MDREQIERARKEGYSDREIVDFLSASNPKLSTARQEGYSDKEIIDHLSPPPGIVARAADAVGEAAGTAYDYLRTQGNRALGNVAGLPRAAVEGIDAIGRLDAAKGGTGARVPQAVKEILPTAQEATDRFNRPNMPTSALWDDQKFEDWYKNRLTPRPEVTIDPVVDAAVQGALSLPFMGVTSAAGIGANIAAPAVSEAAGQVAKDTPYEIPARLIGAVAGGVGGAAAGAGLRKTADIARGIMEPFTESGRKGIAGQALRDRASNADDAIARMDAYEPPVPGFKLPAGKASLDPGLMAVQEVAEGKVPGMRLTYNANNDVLTRTLDSLSDADPRAIVRALGEIDTAAARSAQAALDALPKGVDAATAGQAIRNALRGRYDTLTAARATATEPLYAEARASTTPVKPFPLMMSTADAVAANKGDLKSTAQAVRKLLFLPNGKPDRSAAGMMATRDALTDMIGSAPPGSKQQRMLMGFKDEIDEALSVVPPEKLARQTYAEMSRPLDPFSAEKGAPFVANVIEKDRYGTNFMLPTERVPATFFRPGDAGAATMKEFLAANGGNAQAVSAMREFIAGKAREAGDVGAFLAKHKQAIQTLDPNLTKQLQGAAGTAAFRDAIRSGPAGKFLQSDLDAAVRSTLGAGDATKRMQSLRMTVGTDADAMGGLQRAVLDDFRRSALTTVAEDATGNARMTADGASRWLNANKGAAANVLTADQVKGLEAITRALKDQAASIPGRTGSQTFDRLASESILGALVSKRFAEAPMLAPVRRIIGFAYGGADEAVMNTLFDAMSDPKVASALMKKATPGNVKMVEPILRSIGRGSAVGALTVQEAGQ